MALGYADQDGENVRRPLGLVTIIAASGIVLGSAGTIAVQKLARANRTAIDGPDGDEPAEEIE